MVSESKEQPEGRHGFGKPSKLREIERSCPFAQFPAQRKERGDRKTVRDQHDGGARQAERLPGKMPRKR